MRRVLGGTGNDMERQFKGSGLLFLRNVFLYVLVTGPLVSASLMGAAWPHLYLSLLVLSLIALPPVAVVVDRFDGFAFDDERQAVIKPLGKDIPYLRMQRLNVRETSGLLRVTVKAGRFASLSLASALPVRDKARLLEEFARRAPHAVIREQRHADWKSLLLIALFIFIAAAGVHIYLYASQPLIRVHPQQLPEANDETKKDAARPGTRVYAVGDFDILLPDRFLPGRTGDAQAEFVDNAGQTLIRAEVETRKEGTGRGIFLLATGMGSRAGILDQAYTARIGVIPLLLKDFVLEGMDDVQIFDVRNNGLRGYITRGKRKYDEAALIVLSEDAGGAAINLSISGLKRLDETSLQRIAMDTRLRRK